MPEPFSATAPIKSLSGTATNPGVSFTGDEDTGLYRSGANELAVTVGGAEAAKFTATGMEIDGDISLDDGGTYTTTLQTITPTAARTISFPDATGTVALVGGSSGQLVYNNAGAQAGAPGSVVGATGDITLGLNGAASTPPLELTGTWFTGGTSTTTKPQVLIEPTGATSTAWSTSGTGLGVNAASGFTGRLLDLQLNGSTRFVVTSAGKLGSNGSFYDGFIDFATDTGRVLIGRNDVGSVLAIGLNADKGMTLASDSSVGWSSSGAVNGPNFDGDLKLFRDAADTLAQRNGTNAQTYRLYNTFTDASNYERGFLRWSSNVFEVGPEAAGTGTARPMRITAATLKLPNLPTYADNAAALAGSLVAGDVYKTATGELRITV
jgi:hypothetical protein